jgi:hypothetical protein
MERTEIIWKIKEIQDKATALLREQAELQKEFQSVLTDECSKVEDLFYTKQEAEEEGERETSMKWNHPLGDVISFTARRLGGRVGPMSDYNPFAKRLEFWVPSHCF